MRLIDADYIKNALSVFSDAEHGDARFLAIASAKEIVENAPTCEGWIATENALPKDKQGVVFIVNNGGYYVAELGTYHKDSEMFWSNRCCAAYKKTMVSYWAPFKG